MTDLADLQAALDLLTRDRGPAHAAVLAAAAAAHLARDLADETRMNASALGRVVAAEHARGGDVAGALSVAPHLDAIAEIGATPPVDVEGAPPVSLADRLAAALFHSEAGQAARAAHRERVARCRAALAPAEEAQAEATRLARTVASCRRRLADLEQRYRAACEALVRDGAAACAAVDAEIP